MVKLKNESGMCKVVAEGSLVEIASEIGDCIRQMWQQLPPEDQEDMKGMMQHLMADESPMWKREGEGPVS